MYMKRVSRVSYRTDLEWEFYPEAASGTPEPVVDNDAFHGASRCDRYAFSQRTVNADSALQYSRARCCDPQPGRWLTEDPVACNDQDANLHRYVGTPSASSLEEP